MSDPTTELRKSQWEAAVHSLYIAAAKAGVPATSIPVFLAGMILCWAMRHPEQAQYWHQHLMSLAGTAPGDGAIVLIDGHVENLAALLTTGAADLEGVVEEMSALMRRREEARG